jgi:hypothetical protein
LALLVIIMGLLLAGGGAFFLLLGFDIVMTERGAAMTIGGAVALAGGVVTLGLGFALFRLTQILRALETGPVRAETSPVPTGGTAGSDAMQMMAIGGAAAGAAAAAALSGAVAPREKGADRVVANAPVGAVDIPRVSLLRPGIDDRDTADADQIEQDPPGDALRDILQDTPAAPSPEPADLEIAPSERGDDVVDDAGAGHDAEHHASDKADMDFLLQTRRDRWLEAKDAGQDEQPATNTEEGPEPDDSGQIADAVHERVEIARPEQTSDAVETEPSDAADLTAPQLAGLGRMLLGSYRAGGWTYTMYSDGSVEAAVGDTVEKFESMEALRAHLGRT